ncbi:MAG TPA: hypothetical protein VKY40_07405 [Halanaerobiales bacterium]|nr:hypothetical protein [Halanaerobiales bacterium]
MHIFFMIFFLFLGSMGLFYGNVVGVFVGFGLLPWQVIRLGKGRVLNLAAICISALIGIVFFIMISRWEFLALFIFIQLYNLWGHYQSLKRQQENTDKKNNNRT